MTKTQLKRKIDELVSLASDVAYLHGKEKQMSLLRNQINAQIDEMYQGAADDEDFERTDSCYNCWRSAMNLPSAEETRIIDMIDARYE